MNNSSRGRGRRQYNDYNNNYDNNNDYDQSGGGSSIFSRLGPRGGGNQGGPNNGYNDGGGQRGGGGMRNFDNSMNNNSNNNYHNNNSNRHNNYQQSRGRGGFGGGGGRFNDNQDDLFSSGPRSQPRGGGGNRGNRGRGRGFDGGHQNHDTQQRWKSNNGRQYTRKFVDEDIEMDAPAMGGQGIIVAVSGHPGGAEEKLLGFLQRKSKQPWQALNVRSEQGTMYITVADENSANAVARLNNYNFGNTVLDIRLVDGSGSGGASQRQRGGPSGGGGRSNALEEFLQERWDAPRGFLNLDELPKTRHPIGVVIARLLMVAVDLCGSQMMTISFARNGLWSVKPLKKLPELFPGLQNLSIQDNEIAEFRSLDEFANKFSNLAELMLMGNPIQTQHDWQQYQSEVARRFPSVQMLDQQPVGHSVAPPPPAFGVTGSPAGFGTPPPAPPSNVPETRGNFFDQPSSQQATEDLLSQYFPLFDSNRAALVDLYDAQSCFSVSVAGSAPYAVATWGQAPRLVVGNENIKQRLAALPPTIHDLTPSNIMVDALQTSVAQNVLLSIAIHGQFKEATGANGQVYSFDRVMIVAPAQAGSRAQTAGWRYVILQDSFIVHK